MTSAPAPNSIYTLPLAWHGMACPHCLCDDQLEISFQGTAKLTDDGSVDSGDHEWNDYSRCTCTKCGFTAMALAFRMGDEDEEVPVPVHDKDLDFRPTEEAYLDDLVTAVSFALEKKAEGDKVQITLTRTIGDWDLILFDKTFPAGSLEAEGAYGMLHIGIHDHL